VADVGPAKSRRDTAQIASPQAFKDCEIWHKVARFDKGATRFFPLISASHLAHRIGPPFGVLSFGPSPANWPKTMLEIGVASRVAN
jgi:hypothetical protein